MKRHSRWALLLAIPLALILIKMFDDRPIAVTLVYDVTALGLGEVALDIGFFRDGDKILTSHITRVPGKLAHGVRLAKGAYSVRFTAHAASGETVAIDRTVVIAKEEAITIHLAR